MPTLEEEAEARVAAKAAHHRLRHQLGLAHTRIWEARADVRAHFEEALEALLEDPDDVDRQEVAATAHARLDAFESLQTTVTSRRDAAMAAGEGI